MNTAQVSLLQKFLRSKNCPTGAEGVLDAATVSGYQDYLMVHCGESMQRSRLIIPQTIHDLSAEAQSFIAAGDKPVAKKEDVKDEAKTEVKKDTFLEKGKAVVKKVIK